MKITEKKRKYCDIYIAVIKKRKTNRVTFSSVICFVLLCLVADSTSCHVLGFNLWTSSLWVHFLITGRRILWVSSTASLDLTNRLRAPLSKLDLELDRLATEAQLPWVQHLFNYVSSLVLLLPPPLWFFCFRVLSSWVIFSIIFSVPESLVLSAIK